LASEPAVVTLHHGTTLQRAKLIEANRPNPHFREPGGDHQPAAGGFSMCLTEVEDCPTGYPRRAAHDKNLLYPSEGGPAILEVLVPEWILAILYADPVGAFNARGKEIRFEPESGLMELLEAWPTLSKRVIPL
jgi:hypothetical protein